MAIFLLVRHGENDWVGKKLAGRLPGIHLNQHGVEQAKKTAETLTKMPIKAIYSSPLERAMETADPLSEMINLPINVMPGLQEIDFGSWQGYSIKQLSKRKLWKIVQNTPSEMTFPEGESFIQAQSRLVDAITTINKNHDENDLVACFSHSDSIRLLVAYFLNMNLNDFQRISITTASVSVIHLHSKFTHLPFINQVITQDFSTFFHRKPDHK